MNKAGKILRKTGHILLDMFYYASMALCAFIFLRVFVFSSYKIPSDSMEPAILPGDYVLVNKPAYGARIFDLFSAVEGKEVKIKRVPGYTSVQHNDVVVCHIPYPNNPDKMEMHMLRYYIKRCIGVPGDTLRIVNGIYAVNGDTSKRLGDYVKELALSRKTKEDFRGGGYHTFPWDTLVNWNIKDFGPLYLPRKGDRITLDETKSLIYKKSLSGRKDILFHWRITRCWIMEKPCKSTLFAMTIISWGATRWKIRMIPVIGGCFPTIWSWGRHG